MPTRTQERKAQDRKGDSPERKVGTYIYGIVPADVELAPDAHGIGDPPGQVELVRHGEVAALVSEIRTDRPIGRPADLKLHEQLLDATAAADVPVLPMRFGAVMTSPDAVEEELLNTHHERFAQALQELDGRVEYVVQGRFEEQAILARVIRDDPKLAKMREQLQGMDDDLALDARIELGQAINEAIEASRDRHTSALVDKLEPVTVVSSVREPTSELDAFYVAFLVDLDRADEFEQAVEQFAAELKGLVKARLRGPLAAFDFIVAASGED